MVPYGVDSSGIARALLVDAAGSPIVTYAAPPSVVVTPNPLPVILTAGSALAGRINGHNGDKLFAYAATVNSNSITPALVAGTNNVQIMAAPAANTLRRFTGFVFRCNSASITAVRLVDGGAGFFYAQEGADLALNRYRYALVEFTSTFAINLVVLTATAGDTVNWTLTGHTMSI